MRRHIVVILCALLLLALPHAARAQTSEPRTRAQFEAAMLAAFDADELAKAVDILQKWIRFEPNNFVPWYNLACALSMQRETAAAIEALDEAINRGFADRQQAETDPHLANLRPTDAFKKLMADWPARMQRRAERQIEAIRAVYRVGQPGSPYVIERDDRLRLVFVSAADPKLFAQARDEIKQLARWWDAHVLPPNANTPGPTTPSENWPAVLVVLPTRDDFLIWAKQRYGDAYDRVGGAYSNDEKKLVAMDLGPSLRHEFWHVLHWRHMDQLAQRHPFWIMEGLCSLVEDVTADEHGKMIVLPNWRTNIVRRLARGGNLTPWSTLFTLDQKRFMTSRPSAFYAQSRAVFMFLHERGKLADWYRAYTANYKEDPSGLDAMATAFGKPAKEVERDFRLWARSIPEVHERIGEAAANLPFDVDNGAGQGPIVVDDPMANFLAQRAPKSADVRAGDTITAIDGKPVRDLNDLIRVLSNFDAGEVVAVEFIRKGKHQTAQVKLVGPRSQSPAQPDAVTKPPQLGVPNRQR